MSSLRNAVKRITHKERSQRRDMSLKVHFSVDTEGLETEDDPTRLSKLYIPSKWVPDSTVAEVDERIRRFFNEVETLFTR